MYIMSEQDKDNDDGNLLLDRPPTEDKEKLREPSKYAVVFLNDDYTHMEFVVGLLQTYFSKSEGEAEAIMLDVHKKGKGIAGIYSKDIAETKAYVAIATSQEYGHPLLCQVEKVDI
jgi:ATP-dependent Clp protease adaptor protein ClpS